MTNSVGISKIYLRRVTRTNCGSDPGKILAGVLDEILGGTQCEILGIAYVEISRSVHGCNLGRNPGRVPAKSQKSITRGIYGTFQSKISGKNSEATLGEMPRGIPEVII